MEIMPLDRKWETICDSLTCNNITFFAYCTMPIPLEDPKLFGEMTGIILYLMKALKLLI